MATLRSTIGLVGVAVSQQLERQLSTPTGKLCLARLLPWKFAAAVSLSGAVVLDPVTTTDPLQMSIRWGDFWIWVPIFLAAALRCYGLFSRVAHHETGKQSDPRTWRPGGRRTTIPNTRLKLLVSSNGQPPSCPRLYFRKPLNPPHWDH